jgi:hypothetical protein
MTLNLAHSGGNKSGTGRHGRLGNDPTRSFSGDPEITCPLCRLRERVKAGGHNNILDHLYLRMIYCVTMDRAVKSKVYGMTAEAMSEEND